MATNEDENHGSEVNFSIDMAEQDLEGLREDLNKERDLRLRLENMKNSNSFDLLPKLQQLIKSVAEKSKVS